MEFDLLGDSLRVTTAAQRGTSSAQFPLWTLLLAAAEVPLQQLLCLTPVKKRSASIDVLSSEA